MGRVQRVYKGGDLEVEFPSASGGDPATFTFREDRLLRVAKEVLLRRRSDAGGRKLSESERASSEADIARAFKAHV